jgi:hypothetical protein
MDRPSLEQALEQRDQVIRAFVDDAGRLVQLPAKMVKRLVLLDHVAQAFEVGRHYPEREVNEILRHFYDDWALLRRCLVDEAFLTRQDGVYWRSGGTVA